MPFPLRTGQCNSTSASLGLSQEQFCKRPLTHGSNPITFFRGELNILSTIETKPVEEREGRCTGERRKRQGVLVPLRNMLYYVAKYDSLSSLLAPCKHYMVESEIRKFVTLLEHCRLGAINDHGHHHLSTCLLQSL